MIHFDDKYFRKFKFSDDDFKHYFENAERDLEIASKDSFPEVKFSYSYQSLIKSGIALIAKTGGVKVRSVPGHHIKILEKMSQILEDPDILVIGNSMRTKRNTDFYGGGEFISIKEAEECFNFVKAVFQKIKQI